MKLTCEKRVAISPSRRSVSVNCRDYRPGNSSDCLRSPGPVPVSTPASPSGVPVSVLGSVRAWTLGGGLVTHAPGVPLSPSSSGGRLETLPPRSCVSSDTGAQPCPPKAVVPVTCLKHKSETLSCASARGRGSFSVEWALPSGRGKEPRCQRAPVKTR